jgi:hypothetical protein
MTRPRSQQINDPSTRYTRYSLPTNPTPGALSTVISGADYNSLIIRTATQIPGGSEVPTSAVLTGSNPDPFGVAAGFAFNVSYDGNAPVPVVLLAGEDTGYEIANKINTTLSTTVASRTNEGYLRLTSPTAGSNSVVSISGLPGNLAILGFGPVASATAYGTDPTRGIVTNGSDNLGGYLFINGSDNSPVVATSDTLFSSDTLSGEAQLGSTSVFTQKIPTGQPVYGRLTYNSSGPSLIINWYAKCDGSEPIRSYLSDFPSINPGDTLTLAYLDPFTASGNSFTAAFAGSEATSADVAFRINNAWNGTTGGLFGKIVSSLNGPYFPSGNLVFRLNGGANITVSFSGDKKFAADIVSDINTAIIALAQPGQAVVSGSTFRIESTAPLLTGGETSIVEILPASNPNALRALGLSVGKYAGWQICRAVGAEIEISMPSPYTIYTISSASTALVALGLSLYPVSPNSLPTVTREVPVGFPTVPTSITALPFSSQPTSGAYNILIPEYMEAGDIQDNNFTQNKLSDNVTSNTSAYASSLTGGGALNFGSQARYGRDGNLQPLSMPFFVPQMKIGGITFNNQAVDPLTYATFRTGSSTTTFEALSSTQPSLRTSITPNSVIYSNPSYTITSNLLNVGADVFNADDLALPGSILNLSTDSFSVSLRDGGVADPYQPENDVILQSSSILTSLDRDFVFNKDTVLNFASAAGKITDSNISGVGGPTLGYIPVSDSDSLALKAHDQVLQSSSLLQHVNARIEITIGDGVNTFGDFNGSTALDDVVNLLALDLTLRPVVIKCKSGNYTPTSTLSFTRDVTIIGDGNDVNIQPPSGGGDTLDFSGLGKEIILENISVSCDTSSFSIVSSCPITATRCEFVCVKLTSSVAGSLYADFNNCTITSIPTSIGLSIIHGSGTPSLSFRGCTFNSSTLDSRCVRVTGKAGNSPFQMIKFEDCVFSLGPCTVTSAGSGYTYPYSAANTGLIELDPINDGRTTPGLVIDRLIYKNCTVSALQSGVIIQLTSSLTNQLASAYATPGTYGSITNLEFSGCKFTGLLSPSASLSLSGFTIGNGIENLTIDNCDFYNNLPSPTTGLLGSTPEWWLSTNPSNNQTKAAVLIGCSNTTFTNNRIHNVTPNTTNTVASSYFYQLYGNSSIISNNKFFPDSTKRGDGTTFLGRLVYLISDPSSPYYVSTGTCVFNNNEMVGSSTINPADEWFASAVLVSGDNLKIENNNVKGWTVINSTIANSAFTFAAFSTNINISKNNTSDTNYGVLLAGRGIDYVTVSDNIIQVGDYAPALLSSGIFYANTNASFANYINISRNYITNLNILQFPAVIDLTVFEYDGQGISPTDVVSPACQVLNNVVNFGGWGATKAAYRLRPGGPSLITGDRDPKGVIVGNVSYIANNPPFLAQFGEFFIEKWDQGTTSYQSINGQDIPRYKLIGAHTDNNKTEYKASSAFILAAGGTSRTTDYMVVTGLPEKSSLSLSVDITFANTLDNLTLFRVQYSTNSGVTWIDVPNTVRSISAPPPASGSITVNAVLSLTVDEVWIDVQANAAASALGNITFDYRATVVTPKPVYQSDTTMLMNSCLLKP